MKKINWSKITPHLIAIGIFLLVAIIYCKPALQGKVLQQGDIIHWKGMAQNSFKYKETHGHFPLWTNGMFSGMPAYQIAMDPKNPFNLIYLHKVFSLFLLKPVVFFFLLCIGFYFLSQVYKVNYKIGIMGALAYAYASFNSILIVAGHETQVLAMAYMPAVLGAVLLVYQKRYLIGGALTALLTGLFVAMNHLQVTYYFLIVAGIMTIYYLIEWIRAKDYKHIIKALAIVAVTGVIGVASNAVILATTYDYSKATMRNGVLNLDSTKTNNIATAGLPIDYAFQWSFQKSEVFSILVPNIYGGVSAGNNGLDKDSHFAKFAIQNGVPDDQAAQFAGSMPAYWGEQPFTSGPVYFGAVICFLFLFGMIYLKRNDKWWMLAVSVLAIMMSWGRFFPGFNDFLFNHFPMYNKFRVPTYTLIIPQLLFPLLSVLALHQLFFVETDKAYVWKKLKISGIAMAGVFLIVAMLYSSFTYESSTDNTLVSQLTQMTGGNKDVANNFYNALKQDRQSLFGSDLIRSLIFAGLAFACLYLFVKDKVKSSYLLIALLVLSSIDVLAEGRRYLNDNSFQTEEDQESQNFSPSAVDQQILQDTSYYRVLNLAADTYNDAMTSYFHNSIGGYNPAKLAIYQDLITYQLSGKLNINVLNMLNTKYVIVRTQQGDVVQQNPDDLGACWFAKQVAFVKDDAAAMRALDNNKPADSAIIEESEKSKIPFTTVADSTAKIQLIKNDNDVITYQSESNTNQFAVFSEIYYDRGWHAYIDNKEAPIVRTDYALRGLAIPAGNHSIRFEFKPTSFYDSETIEIIASAIVWLLLIATAYIIVKRKSIQTI